MQELNDADLDRIVDDILGTPAQPDTRRNFICRRCGAEFKSGKKNPTLCPGCLRASQAVRAKLGGAAKRKKTADELPPDPPQDPVPDPEPEPEWLTVQNLLDLLARVPEPERTRVELNGDTIATGVELRSTWHVGGRTEAVIIIRDD